MNDKPISHTTRLGVSFTARRPDLKGGVRVRHLVSGISQQQEREAYFEFAAWHAMEIWPQLHGGFTGYGSVQFEREPGESEDSGDGCRGCAEAYQVVGALAGEHFDSPQVQKALDNLSASASGRPRPHDDVLPFSVESPGETQPAEKTG